MSTDLDPPLAPPSDYALTEVAEEHARAAANVAEWRKYLPESCVDSMIKDGWHYTV